MGVLIIKILKAGKELQEWKKDNTPEYCPLCGRLMASVIEKNRIADHDHKTGKIRGVLCRNCNGLEGKIKNICVRAGKHVPDDDFLLNILAYWKANPSVLFARDETYYPGTTMLNGKMYPPKKKRRKRK